MTDTTERLAHLEGQFASLATYLPSFLEAFNKANGEQRADIAAMRNELRGDMAQLKTEVRGDMAQLKTEVRGDMAEIKTELRDDMGAVRSNLAGTTASRYANAIALFAVAASIIAAIILK